VEGQATTDVVKCATEFVVKESIKHLENIGTEEETTVVEEKVSNGSDATNL
jgi:hypothetical protein